MKERLQKLISIAGIASRRSAEIMIRDGKVQVNGVIAKLGQCADPTSDIITVEGKQIDISTPRTYIMLNKPRGYVTTLNDEKGRPTVADLLKNTGKRLYPVGRLDMDSDGLLLMTDDGALANRMMHPSHEIGKQYLTEVTGDIETALPILMSPIEIDGYRIHPASVELVKEQVLLITIHEGRNRQVRRMCEIAGLKVKRLTRIAEGNLYLGDLPVGQWRYLTENEISSLVSSINCT